MAASARLNLLSPTRLSKTVAALLFFVLIMVFVDIEIVSTRESKRLVEIQLDTLLRRSVNLLQREEYRSLVESAGSDFKDLYLSVQLGGASFVSGSRNSSEVCAVRTLSSSSGSFNPSNTKTVITFCRPRANYRLLMYTAALVFLLIAYCSYSYIHRLEDSAVDQLMELIALSGFPAAKTDNLADLLSRLSLIKTDLDIMRTREVEVARAEVYAQVTYQIGHDIQSPIAALNVALSDLSPEAGPTHDLIVGAIGHIRGMANELKDRFKFERKIVPIFELGTSVRQIVELKKAELRNRGIMISFVEDLPPLVSVFGEKLEFQRILSNIINNAFEASPKHGKIEVALANSDEIYFEVRVDDGGPGISDDVLSRLGQIGLTDKKFGTGLGLYHAKTCIERWQGKLAIFRLERGGTRVAILMRKSVDPFS